MSTSQQLNFKLTLCTAISGIHRGGTGAGIRDTGGIRGGGSTMVNSWLGLPLPLTALLGNWGHAHTASRMSY